MDTSSFYSAYPRSADRHLTECPGNVLPADENAVFHDPFPRPGGHPEGER
jgi:hypothetical protein